MSTRPNHSVALPSVETLQVLLEKLRVRHAGWQQAQQLMAAQLAPHFSPYTVYRSQEVDVSRHLALLLDPKGTHGQGSLFWDAWVELVLEMQDNYRNGLESCTTQTSDWLRKAKVQHIEVEHPTAEGRFIDLCTRTNSGVLAIENKPWLWSQDGSAQLRDYASHLKVAAGSEAWKLVYLAHSAPAEHSWGESERAVAAQLGQFVFVPWPRLLEVLQACVPKIQAAKVRWFVEDFIQMMGQAMRQTDSAQMMHLAAAFNQTPQSLKSALLLRDTLRQWQVGQLAKLRQVLTQRCAALGIGLVWEIYPENPQKKYQRFELTFAKHPQVRFKLEWNGIGLDEQSIFWGLNEPAMKADRARAMFAALCESCPNWARVNAPEAGWPYWTYLENDTLFDEGLEDAECLSTHPWLSIEYEGELNFVALVLQRYKEASTALDKECMQRFLA